MLSSTPSDDNDVRNLYISLWFGFLKVQLNFNEKDRVLGTCVQENIMRCMSYLVIQNGICKENDEIWNKSWKVINSIFP